MTGDGYYRCQVCGKLYEPSRTTQKYCERRCAMRAAWLKSDAKQKAAKAMRERDS